MPPMRERLVPITLGMGVAMTIAAHYTAGRLKEAMLVANGLRTAPERAAEGGTEFEQPTLARSPSIFDGVRRAPPASPPTPLLHRCAHTPRPRRLMRQVVNTIFAAELHRLLPQLEERSPSPSRSP